MKESTALSVLLVDDDKDLRETLAQYLEGEGFRVTACRNCHEAMEALDAPGARFHLVLADLRLPDGDGLEVVKKSGQAGNCLAAVMTGYASLETALEAIRSGAYDYITKPFSLDEIDILIRNMSEKLQLTEQNRQTQQRLEQVYSRVGILHDEKVELIRSNREMKREFESLSGKLDELTGLLHSVLGGKGDRI